ncbi:MAG: ATP-binding protein [Pyrinomonadaceae bacterium]
MPWVIGTLALVSLALLIILQSTNWWKEFAVNSSSDLLLLYALSSLNFVAFMIFAFIFLRSIIKLVRERRTFTLGAKLKSRLLVYFFAVSLLPIIAMAVFSYLFMNRALERWFTQIPEQTIKEARSVQEQSLIDRSARLDESARMLAASLSDRQVDAKDLAQIAEVGSLAHISLLSANRSSREAFDRNVGPKEKLEIERLISEVTLASSADATLRDGRGFDVVAATLVDGRMLIIIPDPFDERTVSQIVDNSLLEFDRLKENQINVRQVGLLTLGLLTFLLMFASSWIAFYVARGLTTPIRAIAEGAGEIAMGNLSHRVDVLAEDELAILVDAFNDMSSRLESNSTELGERRRYIETVLETLPTGVISFDAEDRITTVNSAATAFLELPNRGDVHMTIKDIPSDEARSIIAKLTSRATRVGHASDQIVLKAGGAGDHAGRSLAITASTLPAGDGVVLVFEDLSELIAAQRSSAWQEVARRMAHEIKNPLTPIQLSAERIAKRLNAEGNGARSSALGEVVIQSTATILREVSSLKTMVDEFSRFARLPEVNLSPGDLQGVITNSVVSFDGRLRGASLEFTENGHMPSVMLDAAQMGRVFGNLIDNALEAADIAGEATQITIKVRHDVARDLVVAEVSDTGAGIDPADLQKLFQPYFSTKGRGTGLGLAIVNRIVSEHHGRIKVVANTPRGARFIIELPVNV